MTMLAAQKPGELILVAVQGIVSLIEAQLSRKRYLELGLKVGQQVVIAARATRVFPASASPSPSGSVSG